MGEVLHWFYEPLTVVLFMATVNITRSDVKEIESLPYTGSLAIFLSILECGVKTHPGRGWHTLNGTEMDYDYIYIVYESRTCELSAFHSSATR